jgi:hypothetical protein
LETALARLRCEAPAWPAHEEGGPCVDGPPSFRSSSKGALRLLEAGRAARYSGALSPIARTTVAAIAIVGLVMTLVGAPIAPVLIGAAGAVVIVVLRERRNR